MNVITFLAKQATKPNIVFVFADDLGYNDIGYNNPEVISPNLDGLASDGVILGNNYAHPVCTPYVYCHFISKYFHFSHVYYEL